MAHPFNSSPDVSSEADDGGGSSGPFIRPGDTIPIETGASVQIDHWFPGDQKVVERIGGWRRGTEIGEAHIGRQQRSHQPLEWQGDLRFQGNRRFVWRPQFHDFEPRDTHQFMRDATADGMNMGGIRVLNRQGKRTVAVWKPRDEEATGLRAGSKEKTSFLK